MAEPAIQQETPGVEVTQEGLFEITAGDHIIRLRREQAADLTRKLSQSLHEGYSDEQFEADVNRALPELDKMAASALEEHRLGKTRAFPRS